MSGVFGALDFGTRYLVRLFLAGPGGVAEYRCLSHLTTLR